MNKAVLIDGSRHSGSGTLLRSALILSSVTKIPFEMINCISNREKKGLGKSHIKTIELFQQSTDAEVKGLGLGSQIISFNPKKTFSKKKIIIERSSGSVSLILQALITASLFSKNKTTIVARGGTHLDRTPSLSSLRETFLRLIHKYTEENKLFIENIAFSFEDEGSSTTVIKPRETDITSIPLIIDAQELVMIKGEFLASKSLAKINLLESFSRIAELGLKSYEVPVRITTRYSESNIDCLNMHLFAYYGDEQGFDNDKAVVISADKRIEKDFMERQVYDLLDSFKNRLLNKALDPFIVDALIPIVALLGGTLESEEINERILGSIYVAEKILDVKFEIDSNVISCKGYFNNNDDSAIDIDDI
ncbi:MAG: RNA 3'-terminal phosphate cyclase [Patescibacteria group bacterium]|nr:RNA 3'-terminal phosphate cyclase [Patescibacteria group bacterium]